MRLIWVRHGETEGNRQRRYVGHWDDPLNERGRQQARKVAERLSREPVSAIYTSDLCRAEETASVIAAHHPSVPVQVTPLLRECAFGEWEGRTYDEIAANGEMHLQRWYDDPWCVSPPGGECLQEMEQRISLWLEALAVRHGSGDTVVAVAHTGPIRLFHAKWVKRNPRELWDFSLPHGEVWAVRRRGDGWEVEPWNPS
ncbi:histidine phosphatase family protein [Polycladomyces subterraneus]|uniref:Histidine phosphatase family protein n=1 Tax=Polycladomyces subterraneus TaxID=1016997 RepID=A0ABT8IM02_9BACL|nr:histidine phosphatase family protein [Polycladomyces subterraneus]MDN4593812.1 histidine phosphatase family protein [Polycladomyces subterraneus]